MKQSTLNKITQVRNAGRKAWKWMQGNQMTLLIAMNLVLAIIIWGLV